MVLVNILELVNIFFNCIFLNNWLLRKFINIFYCLVEVVWERGFNVCFLNIEIFINNNVIGIKVK